MRCPCGTSSVTTAEPPMEENDQATPRTKRAIDTTV